MRHIWQDHDWRAQPTRRAFLGGVAAIAAPYVVKSGILMPVKAILRPTVVSKLQYQDPTTGEWFDVVRYVGGAPVRRGLSYPLNMSNGAPMVPPGASMRTLVEQDWRPAPPMRIDLAAKAARRYRATA